MQLTITSADGENVAQINVQPNDLISSVLLGLQTKFGIPAANQILLLNGNPLRLDQTFLLAGVKENDLVVIVSASNSDSTSNSSITNPVTPPAFSVRPNMRMHEIPPNASPEVLIEIIDKNPHLLSELKQSNPKLATALESKNVANVRMVILQMHMEEASRRFKEQEAAAALDANPFDAEAQSKIEEAIRLSNVQKNMEIAIEEMPEAFARVYMLYIPCEVNGTQVKAFVDSGAQSTIMSSSCAERCGIMRLVDKRFAGQAVGVGTAKIIGKVHMAPLKIGNYFYNCSFTILDQQNVDFLFGLDMLKRHQCCIDLHKNVLRLHESSVFHEVPFLPEHEIPSSDRSTQEEQQTSSSQATPAFGSAPPPAPAPSLPAASSSQADKIQSLIALGFDEAQARQALEQTNGNAELAAGLLFENLG